MRPVILPFPDDAETAASLAERLDAEVGAVTWRRFPEGETYVRTEKCGARGGLVKPRQNTPFGG